jgi:hypothetical protein
MEEGAVAYLKLHEAVARTSSPGDQPPFQGLDPFFQLLASLPADGDLSRISEETYGQILSTAKQELLHG